VPTEPTEAEIEQAILAALEPTGDDLVRWTPIRDRLPGEFWAKNRAFERLRCRGDIYAMKMWGTPYVCLGDEMDREIARRAAAEGGSAVGTPTCDDNSDAEDAMQSGYAPRGPSTALVGGLVAGAIAVYLAAPASADYDAPGYIDALNKEGLISGPYGGSAHQFENSDAALWTGMWVCRNVEQGRSRDSIVYDLDHGDGMEMNATDAAIIYDTATTFLC
jgi:Protein of unknown function (DUF732)